MVTKKILGCGKQLTVGIASDEIITQCRPVPKLNYVLVLMYVFATHLRSVKVGWVSFLNPAFKIHFTMQYPHNFNSIFFELFVEDYVMTCLNP